MQLSQSSARALHLAAQGLLSPRPGIANKDDVLAVIRQMCALQIDTISVVARSPYLVLWSRLGEYNSNWLDELLAEAKIFEYWSHEASFLPIEHYGLYRHQMISPQGLAWKYNHRWLSDNREQVAKIRKHIVQHGETKSSDFERTDGKAGGWWEWKPEKRALELLFTTGELMVARRQNFQRIYNLRERVHSQWDDQRDLKTPLDCQRQQVLLAVRALGIAKPSWIADYFRMKNFNAASEAGKLAEQGLLLTVSVEGWDAPVYIHPEHHTLLQLACDGKLKASATTVLSPFDPVVWDRKRAMELFNFDYKLECYTPAAKRRYGYFTLPILRRGKLIARMDAKAHRKERVFEIKALHLESGTRISQTLTQDLCTAIIRIAQWHQTPEIRLQYCSSAELSDLMNSIL